MTDNIGGDQVHAMRKSDAAGWLAYDTTCAFCVRWVQRVRSILERRHIQLVSLQSPWVREAIKLKDGEEADRIWLLLPDGGQMGGADALIELARRVWWARPVTWMAGFPGMRGLMHKGYMWIAKHRHCLGGTCALPAHTQTLPRQSNRQANTYRAWLPLLLLPVLVMLFAKALPAWGFMWLLAMAIFAGCKWLMYAKALQAGARPTRLRTLAYFIAWPGLDARAVLDAKPLVAFPQRREWVMACLKTLLGIALLWGVTPMVPASQPVAAGWCAMVGIIFILHFGLFHLIALVWRMRGIDAPLMMRNPIAATSLGEFWGKRWNRDFRVLAHEVIFKPTHRRLGIMGSAFLVFLCSGLVHDLVISLPARSGYGLPTAYFLLQFAGIWMEGTGAGKRIGLGRGVRGWAFALLITAGPMFWLFHPAFVHEVILPFTQVIGAR